MDQGEGLSQIFRYIHVHLHELSLCLIEYLSGISIVSQILFLFGDDHSSFGCLRVLAKCHVPVFESVVSVRVLLVFDCCRSVFEGYDKNSRASRSKLRTDDTRNYCPWARHPYLH